MNTVYLNVCIFFYPIDLYKMITDMSRDYNKSNNT